MGVVGGSYESVGGSYGVNSCTILEVGWLACRGETRFAISRVGGVYGGVLELPGNFRPGLATCTKVDLDSG
jgi:hypothetical protein